MASLHDHGIEDAIGRIRAWTAATYAIRQLPGLTIHFIPDASEAMEIASTSRETFAVELCARGAPRIAVRPR